MKKAAILSASVLLLTAAVRSEESPDPYRTWTDLNGNTLKALYVRTAVESVILRLKDGTESKIPIDALSEQDRMYVMLQNPPRIEINMEPSVDMYTVGYLGNDGYDYTVQYQVVEPSVLLRRTSTGAYDAPLAMTVVILGRIKEIDRYVIIDKTHMPFTFTEKQSYEVRYVGYPLDLRQIKGSWKSGVEYKGYLIAIRDSRGMLIAVKSNKVALEQNAEKLTDAEIGSMLTDRLQLIPPRVAVPDVGFEQPELSF